MIRELRPHQATAMDSLRSALASGRRRPMMQAPTGFGKTLLAAAIVESALSKGRRVLFTVPFLSLVDQTVEAFADEGIRAVGVMQGNHEMTDGSQPVQVASVQTLQRRRIPLVDLVMIDEAHRWFDFFGDWMHSPAWERVPFIGLSATPWTKGLGKHYDELIVAATTGDLIQQGYLSPFKVFAPAHPDLSAVKTVAGDYHEGQLADAMSDPILIGDTVSTWLRLGEDRPTLCFAVDRAHARKLANEFEGAGVPTGYVDANTPMDEREAIGNRLKLGQIKVVCNVGCLTTGVDWDVRCIILARPTKSEILYTQIIGRGLRTAEGKQDLTILDHSDTTLRLGFVTDIHHDILDGGKHKTGSDQPREKRVSLPKECSACSFVKPAGVHACPSCGFAPERQSYIEDKTGELVALSGATNARSNATMDEKQTAFSMLLWYAESRGYKPGWAANKYRDKFGVWPRGLLDVSKEPDDAMLRWLKSQQIAWAKAQEKKRAA